ncbi:CYTH and CHAD domain-containing protein [Corallincola luteus]|uniref:CYTH domain-containing protein n=2 Tax=Corallincola TaxID=1775176 RepID=A0A368NPF0_9GAMM|nr:MULTISPECIES: CYTH and CHAD domain-containing protein [Corallincola]RCU51735.1 CYTH domain-containing protein [Corallincola holothuriorum]TCI04893.1 CYTH and CHAD domain-containing protein [Corallincola luteus]
METEIEIKLVIPGESEALVQAIETAADIYYSADKQLANIYFDTPDRQLRAIDTGLRVRTADNVSVQTIKTAGRVVGGLHQRPEYNEPIEGSRPDLALFPADIWPETIVPARLEKQLVPIFSTNFRRRSWCLRFDDGSEVEVALDIGNVEANHQQEPIAEVEFELLKGDPDHLFGLARTISGAVPARLGHLSKAARGYRLAKGETHYERCPLVPVQLSLDMSVEVAFEATLKHILDTIQHNEQSFISCPSFAAVEALYDGYQWLNSALQAYQDAIPLEASETLRDELQWLLKTLAWVPEASFRQHALADKGHQLRKLDDRKLLKSRLAEISDSSPDETEVVTLLLSSRYCQLVLSFTEWLFEQGWRRYLLGATSRLNEPVISLGRDTLIEQWQQLHLLYAGHEFTGDDYLKKFPLLRQALQLRLCFAALFSNEQGTECSEAWLDLSRGTAEWSQLDYLNAVADSLALTDKKPYRRWLERKRNALLHALEQSRQSALDDPLFE